MAEEYNQATRKALNFIILEAQAYIDCTNETDEERILNYIRNLDLHPCHTDVISMENSELAYKAFKDVKRVYMYQILRQVKKYLDRNE